MESLTSIASIEEDLDWLASQPSLLLKHFFYCLNYPLRYVPDASQSFPECLIDKNPRIEKYMSLLGKETFLIFGKLGYTSDTEQEMALKLARKIAQKVNQKIIFK